MSEVRHIRVAAGEGRFAVTLEASVTPEGVACYLYGGTLPHVGGMALAAPGPELNGRRLSRADVWVSTVPGHKDAAAAQEVARQLSIALQRPTSVSCGIHVDDATAEDLAAIGRDVDHVLNDLLAALARPSDGVTDEDQLVLVDLADRPVGTCGKLETHERGLLHRAFSVFLFDGDQLLVTRRAFGKYHSGGLWTNTCCSHPRVGETVAEAAARRLAEELGIADAPPLQEAGTYCYRATLDNGLTEYELDHVLVGEWHGGCAPDAAEVMDARWVPLDQLAADLAACPERYTAWFPGTLSLAMGFCGGRNLPDGTP